MSSSSDDDILLLENPFLKLRNKTIGIHPINRSRKSHGEYHHLFSELKADEERFFKYTRMTFATFNYILNKVENRLSKNWCNWHRQPIFPEERLVVTLRYLATGSSFKTLAFSFRMGASTVGNIVAETVAVLWEELYQLHMPAPTKEIFNSVAKDFFQVWNFPHVIGAIDGKHVRIQCPKNSGSMFYNYKKFYSVVLQAVADANYKFISVDIGGYGKQSDGGTFKASDIYHYLYNEQLDIPEPDNLPGTNVKAPFVLIGDEAYPLLTNLLKPFGGNNLTIEQQCFNKRLSRARKTVECAFGILYSKWRLLSKSIETDIALTDNIVKCMCVLHNTIIDKEGFERHLTEVFLFNEHRQDYRQAIGRSSNAAKSVRDVYATYFSNNPLRYNN